MRLLSQETHNEYEKIVIWLKNNTAKKDSLPVLYFTVTNIAGSFITLNYCGGCVNDFARQNMFILSAAGDTVTCLMPAKEHECGKHPTIEPGKSFTFKIHLSYWDFKKPGEYAILYRYKNKKGEIKTTKTKIILLK